MKQQEINSDEGLRIKVLSSDELDTIHQATLEIMHKTGVRVQSHLAREIFEDNGCPVDHTTEIVKFPAQMVEDAIRWSPGKLLLAGRKPKSDIILEPGTLAFTRTGGL